MKEPRLRGEHQRLLQARLEVGAANVSPNGSYFEDRLTIRGGELQSPPVAETDLTMLDYPHMIIKRQLQAQP